MSFTLGLVSNRKAQLYINTSRHMVKYVAANHVIKINAITYKELLHCLNLKSQPSLVSLLCSPFICGSIVMVKFHKNMYPLMPAVQHNEESGILLA